MRSVLETCQPRPELLAGTFNPEIFTASLSPIIEYYRTGRSTVDSIYTNAELFFKEATYPTQGLRQALTEIFKRLKGDMTVPAIHRLETAFGGGKTHTLIACAHLAFQGTKLRHVVQDIVDPSILPEPNTVCVVGVSGDEIPVHKPRGTDLIPYTLWGEIAYQIGGEALYREVENEATSYAAPGKHYLDKVFQGKKVLIMLDELAQYAARLEAAQSHEADQLAAFLMSLHGYARNHPGIAIVLTLASATDAFSRQTRQLAQLISEVRGEEVNEDDALSIGEQAVQGVSSVVARDAVQITPVQAAEISSVFAKRLFVSIDREAAQDIADEYMEMYRRNAHLLPEEAVNENLRQRLVAHYPFHPSLVDFLNKKLASAENFQGTRGVLRVLSMAVRSLWQKKQPVPMIHTCHLDMRSDQVVNEILGRTGSSELLYVLNADVGGVDTDTLEGGLSNAQLADRQNPHPNGIPFYEYTWKTVFLHSLVGREEGLNSRIFGITESEALFSVAYPGLAPTQVQVALKEIKESAFYLRHEQERYFASGEPTINSVLARIRKSLQDSNNTQVNELINSTARKIINQRDDFFHVEYDVTLPEHLPDGKGKPILGVISPTAGAIDVEAMITTKGPNRPREQQNLIFLLVPNTVVAKDSTEQINMENLDQNKAETIRQHIEQIARQVLAMRILAEKPENYGINPRRLHESDFKIRRNERETALQVAVSQSYTRLYYSSSAKGFTVYKDIQTTGSDAATTIVDRIREALIRDKEILTESHTTQEDLMNLHQLFFHMGDTVAVEALRRNFVCNRKWPVLEKPGVLDQLIREGVKNGAWCVFRLADGESIPSELYHQDQEMPYHVQLTDPGYMLIKVQGVHQRGWLRQPNAEPQEIKQTVLDTVQYKAPITVGEVIAEAKGQFGQGSEESVKDAVIELVSDGLLVVTRHTGFTPDHPEFFDKDTLPSYTPDKYDVLLTPEQAIQQGWQPESSNRFELTGKEGADKLFPLLSRIGSFYHRGARTHIDMLDFLEMELPHGGTLSVRLQDVPPASMKALDEFFEVLGNIVHQGEYTVAYLDVEQPDEDCPFMQELKRK